jgi:hypothetical protein
VHGWKASGTELAGDIWVLILKTAIAVFVLYAVLRRWRPLAAILAPLWTAILLADNLVCANHRPPMCRFTGKA